MLRPFNLTRLRLSQRLFSSNPKAFPTPHDNPFPTAAEYESRWIPFFNEDAYDQFELQRGLNRAFNYDIVPTIPVLEAALRACRRLNDLAQAMRVFGALREKCDSRKQYEEYVKYLDPIKQELGVPAPEDIGRL